jgi:hypothetical protein
VKLGDKITKPVAWLEIQPCGPRGGGNMKKHETATGTVVYIDPKGRFYTLEFTFPAGSFRECFSC